MSECPALASKLAADRSAEIEQQRWPGLVFMLAESGNPVG